MKPEETVDYFLKVVWQNVANTYNQIASGFGITQALGYALINIHDEGTAVSQMANLLGVKSTSLSRMLNNMEGLGLIYRKVSPKWQTLGKNLPHRFWQRQTQRSQRSSAQV